MVCGPLSRGTRQFGAYLDLALQEPPAELQNTEIRKNALESPLGRFFSKMTKYCDPTLGGARLILRQYLFK